jgi:hypothetical protein
MTGLEREFTGNAQQAAWRHRCGQALRNLERDPTLRGSILRSRLPTDGLSALNHSRLCQIPMPFAGCRKKTTVKETNHRGPMTRPLNNLGLKHDGVLHLSVVWNIRPEGARFAPEFARESEISGRDEMPRTWGCYSSVTVARTRTVKCSTVRADAEQRAQSAIPNVPAYRSRSGGFRHLAHQCDPHCHFTVRDPRAAGAGLHRTVEASEY